MIVLAIDTALERCSAAVLDGGGVRASASESMARGHQERLGPLVREVMAEAGVGFPELDRIGVTVGPGSFTGLRVGLAFAKGLGFALGRPVVGVGTLEALAASVEDGTVAAVVDAKRGQLWVQAFRDGVALDGPEALEPAAAIQRLGGLAGPMILVGSGAPLVAGELPDASVVEALAPTPAALARLVAQAAEPIPPPRPIYLRAPDARLPMDRAHPART